MQLTIPPEPDAPARTIRAATLDATASRARGLTRAASPAREYRERGADVDRAGNSGTLDVGLKPAMSVDRRRRFTQGVKFVDGKMAAQRPRRQLRARQRHARADRHEPGMLVAARRQRADYRRRAAIDVTLDGPMLKAAGTVQEHAEAAEAEPAREPDDDEVPSMLKQDQPVNVIADALDYDGDSSRRTYTGARALLQGDTTIKGDAITIDRQDRRPRRRGPVMTTTVLDADRQGQEEGARPRRSAPRRTSNTTKRRAARPTRATPT